MKSKFGTTLALVAVLLTGTAAAAINTQALISPTKSTLGTAATTLLPVDQAVAVVPGQTQVGSVSPEQSLTNSQPQVDSTNPSVAPQGSTQIPVAITPVPSPSLTSITGAPISPSVVYGNPNPSNGEEDDEDEDEDDDDEDDD